MTTTANSDPIKEEQPLGRRRGKRGPRSDKPERILAFLQHYFIENDYPPSVRDIVDGCGLSSTSVADYNLKILEREGHIHRDRERARTISLTRSPLGVPLLGTIAAGTRSLVPEGVVANHAEERISVSTDIVPGLDPQKHFALTVKGDSMIDAYITEDDIVIMEPASRVHNGQMAAVWLHEQEVATLKRVYYEDGRVRLQPENPTMDPIYTDESNMEIQGRVVSVIRQHRS